MFHYIHITYIRFICCLNGKQEFQIRAELASYIRVYIYRYVYKEIIVRESLDLIVISNICVYICMENTYTCIYIYIYSLGLRTHYNEVLPEKTLFSES